MRLRLNAAAPAPFRLVWDARWYHGVGVLFSRPHRAGSTVACPPAMEGRDPNDETKHVVLTVECFRTRVRFSPPPPINKMAAKAAICLVRGRGDRRRVSFP